MDLSRDPDEELDLNKLREKTYLEMKNADSIDYIEKEISYDEFFRRYLLPNRPCILGPWATSSWRSIKEWVSSSLTPNLEFLASQFGYANVPVANCDQEQYASHPKEDMKLSDFIQYLSDQRKDSGKCLYLKDWHFVRGFPDYEAYTTPVFFQSDWLNEFWDSREDDHDDYRFVYIGPKGSWTPFHSDVLRSYSWSANICGLKLWWFYPPGEEEQLKDRFGQLPYDLRSSDMDDTKKFPNYGNSRRKMEVKQRRGEVIFVPSGWHHQVFNLEDTISINHNWLNGCSVDLSWRFVKMSLCEVQREIADCCDMEGWNDQCQLILKASSGIDYAEFYMFIHTIANRRIQFLIEFGKMSDEDSTLAEETEEDPSLLMEKISLETSEKCSEVPSNSSSEETSASCTDRTQESGYPLSNHDKTLIRHYQFDLKRIQWILNDMMEDKDFQEINYSTLPEHPNLFLNRIVTVL